jgi:hypothetical protein
MARLDEVRSGPVGSGRYGKVRCVAVRSGWLRQVR